MKIDFSDYKSLTQKDIFCIDDIGVECTVGKIFFAECCNNFKECHDIIGNYIGEFDCSGSNSSICLYTAPHTTHFFFMGEENQFYEILKSINSYGFELINVEKII